MHCTVCAKEAQTPSTFFKLTKQSFDKLLSADRWVQCRLTWQGCMVCRTRKSGHPPTVAVAPTHLRGMGTYFRQTSGGVGRGQEPVSHSFFPFVVSQPDGHTIAQTMCQELAVQLRPEYDLLYQWFFIADAALLRRIDDPGRWFKQGPTTTTDIDT